MSSTTDDHGSDGRRCLRCGRRAGAADRRPHGARDGAGAGRGQAADTAGAHAERGRREGHGARPVLVDDALNQWQLVPYPTFGNIVQWMPAGSAAWVAAGYSANVTAIEKWQGDLLPDQRHRLVVVGRHDLADRAGRSERARGDATDRRAAGDWQLHGDNRRVLQSVRQAVVP